MDAIKIVLTKLEDLKIFIYFAYCLISKKLMISIVIK